MPEMNSQEKYSLKDDFKISEESVICPCTILFYLGKDDFISACHYDENHSGDLNEFIQNAVDEGVCKMGIFGGYGSSNIVPVLRNLKSKGIGKVVDKNYGVGKVQSFSIDRDGMTVHGEESSKKLKISELSDLFS